MDYFKYKVLETYYYETARHMVRVDIVESLSNETQWRKYSIATLCCEISKEYLDEKDVEYVIEKQIEDLVYRVLGKKKNDDDFNDFYNTVNDK